MHHTVNKYIDLVEKEINALMKQPKATKVYLTEPIRKIL